MSKKKSKTQKYKKNVKRKATKKLQKEEPISNLPTKNPKESLNKSKGRQLVDKDKVNYNVILKKHKTDNKPKVTRKNINLKPSQNKLKKKEPTKLSLTIEKTTSNPVYQFLKKVYNFLENNIHILFNAILIITFIVLNFGFIRCAFLSPKTIIYIGVLLLFLIVIALSYNKYTSGKILTICLCLVMGIVIYYMQYTYDFITSLNTSYYEYKNYYVVTFDLSTNSSIYSINNKKVGLLSDNATNVKKILNIKLDANYQVYDDINALIDDFYDQKFRAIIVNENQYAYLKNHINLNSRDVKTVYEFKANAKRE